jgi:GNAT superfamily N-acetyltransferase
MNVEKLSSLELHRVIPIAEAFCVEAGNPKFDFQAFSELWFPLIESGMGEIYFLEHENAVVGLIGFMMLPKDPFFGRSTALEQFWFVDKEHRKSGVGLLLLDVFEERTKNYEDQVLVHLTACGDFLHKVYERRGYKLVEQTFKKSK